MAKKKKVDESIMLLDGVMLKTGDIIDYVVGKKSFRGTVVEFKIVDPGGMSSPWCRIVDVVSKDSFWISLNIWQSFHGEVIAKGETTPPIPSTEHLMDPEDYI